ncbi:hypothetical protein IWT25_00698 [Secundilactobacillus pentosiphilus]|uniref:Uncharacterized protein n=1 Tax=Secundilactobacillus pentosiphilus TaxID=1714682 RepID=A0A1Z5IUF4_9LACO|nr:hypothetical protein [Secundilactobacillus pentosiphilus]GAX05394.1 hypothetical protein IWT25_00698 [Secundilactobacillus pentosiphilus]
MAFQTHYNFGGAKTHNGGSKSAAKKVLKQFWRYLQGQGAQLSDPVTVSEVATLQHDLLAYGTRVVNSYRVSGGAYAAALSQYVTDCGAYLDQFITENTTHSADTQLTGSRQAFMVQFEHQVNQLIRHYETVITKG